MKKIKTTGLLACVFSLSFFSQQTMAGLEDCNHKQVGDRTTWHVKALSSAPVDGSKSGPLRSTDDINNCTAPGDTILINPSQYTLDGQIVMKPGQTIRGLGDDVTSVSFNPDSAHPQLRNSDTSMGLASVIMMSTDVTIENLRIVLPEKAGTLGSGQQGRVAAIDALGLSEIGSSSISKIRIDANGETSGSVGIRILIGPSILESDITIDNVRMEYDFGELDLMDGISMLPNTGVIVGSINAEINGSITNTHVKNIKEGISLSSFGGEMDFELDSITVVNNSTAPGVLLQSSDGTNLQASLNRYYYDKDADFANASLGQDFVGELVNSSAIFLNPRTFADTLKFKMRNSKITNSSAAGMTVLSRAIGTNALIDLGCTLDTYSECKDESGNPGDNLGNNTILGNGALYLLILSPFSDAEYKRTAGGSLEFDIQTTEMNETIVYAEGNYWGGGPLASGICGKTLQAGSISLLNPLDFDEGETWRCNLSQSVFTGIFSFGQQPELGNPLATDPHQ